MEVFKIVCNNEAPLCSYEIPQRSRSACVADLLNVLNKYSDDALTDTAVSNQISDHDFTNLLNQIENETKSNEMDKEIHDSGNIDIPNKEELLAEFDKVEMKDQTTLLQNFDTDKTDSNTKARALMYYNEFNTRWDIKNVNFERADFKSYFLDYVKFRINFIGQTMMPKFNYFNKKLFQLIKAQNKEYVLESLDFDDKKNLFSMRWDMVGMGLVQHYKIIDLLISLYDFNGDNNKDKDNTFVYNLLGFMMIRRGMEMIMTRFSTFYRREDDELFAKKPLDEILQLYFEDGIRATCKKHYNSKTFVAKYILKHESAAFQELLKLCTEYYGRLTDNFIQNTRDYYNASKNFILNIVGYCLCFLQSYNRQIIEGKDKENEKENYNGQKNELSQLQKILTIFGVFYSITGMKWMSGNVLPERRIRVEKNAINRLIKLTRIFNFSEIECIAAEALETEKEVERKESIKYIDGYTILRDCVTPTAYEHWTLFSIAERNRLYIFRRLLLSPSEPFAFVIPKDAGWDNDVVSIENDKNTKATEINTIYKTISNQISCCKHLLFNLGYKFKNNEISFKDFSKDDKKENTKKRQDAFGLYHDFSTLQKSNTKTKETMNNLVQGLIVSLARKYPVNDDILILCLVYFNYCELDKEGIKLEAQFFDTLKSCVQGCINSDYLDKDTKLRDYQWFKMYLLNSNIWMMPCDVGGDAGDAGDSKDDSKENKKDIAVSTNEKEEEKKTKISVVYDKVVQIVNEALLKQKQMIWDSIDKENKSDDREHWDELIHKKEYITDKMDDLRQDLLEKGIKSDFTSQDLFIVAPTIDHSNNFDLFSVVNTDMYLSKLLIFSHSINSKFQNDMKTYFSKFKCTFQSAPVKLKARCIMKAQTDYNEKTFPSAANIVDCNRCSVTFTTAKDLLFALNELMQLKHNTCVIDVLRVKNGFLNVNNWKSMNDCDYVDIKANVVIFDSNTNQTIIGEIQFLLKWLLRAKKIGHKIYAIKRKEEFIGFVKNELAIDLNYGQYHDKIVNLIKANDFTNIKNELIWKPYLMMSLINKSNEPYLYTCGIYTTSYPKDCKIYALWMSTILYYSKHYFMNKIQSSECFGEKYLNWEDCRTTFNGNFIWGIYTREENIISGSAQEKCIEMLISNKYFHPKLENEDSVSRIVEFCAENSCFLFLKILTKYFDKMSNVFKFGMNYRNDGSNGGGPMFLKMLRRGLGYKMKDKDNGDARDLWILLFDSLNAVKANIKDVNQQKDYWIKKETLETAYKWKNEGWKDPNDGYDREWTVKPNKLHAQLIAQYAKETGQPVN